MGTAHGWSAEMDGRSAEMDGRSTEMDVVKVGGVDEWDLLTNRRCCCE